MSSEKIMRCMASLSDSLGDICGKIELNHILRKPFREVIQNLLAPNDIQFMHVSCGDNEDDEEEEEPTVVSESSKPLPMNLHELADLASHGVTAAQGKLQSLGESVGVDVQKCQCWEHAADEIEKQQKRRKKKPR